MKNIVIQNFHPGNEPTIENITFRTGFKGEGLEGRDYFNDKRLFYLIFIAYYARFEPEHFFVAVDVSSQNTEEKSKFPRDSTTVSPVQRISSPSPLLDTRKGKVVGFICGTLNTALQEKRFARKMIWQIVTRALLVTSWRSPKTFTTLIRLGKMLVELKEDPELTAEIQTYYPAHLHINVLPEYHRTGIGTRLLQRFEAHLVDLDIHGVHLGTSSRNHKAVPFYHKHGYTLLKEVPAMSHPVFDELSFLTFAKRLGNVDNNQDVQNP